MSYLDPETNEKYIPYVIESVGVERLFLAFLANGYMEETLEDGSTRELLKNTSSFISIKRITIK